MNGRRLPARFSRTWLAALAAVLGASPASISHAQTSTMPVPSAPPPPRAPLKPPKLPNKIPDKMPIRPATSAAAAPLPRPLTSPHKGSGLEPLKFLSGKWRCDGKQFASAAFGPEHQFKATAENKPTVDGAWNQFLYEEKASKVHAGVKVHGLWGWEAGSQRLVRAAVSSDGTWDSATSPGLEGDRVVWVGDFSTAIGKSPFRHTFTRRSDTEWTHALELKDANGRWIPTSEVVCKR